VAAQRFAEEAQLHAGRGQPTVQQGAIQFHVSP
jgi:hypothetical protein